MRPKIEICFWGVRGSIATHLTENSHYGGHTSCISICYKKHWFVCDAGTGIRLLGQKLAQKKVPVTILLSHLHWDHLFGLPFFKPLYEKNRKMEGQYHSFDGTAEDIWESGDKVYERGTFGVSLSYKDHPKPLAYYGSYFTIWQKASADSLKIKFVSWHLSFNPCD